MPKWRFSPKKLRELRKDDRISQRRLAKEVGRAYQTLQNWEYGVLIPRASDIANLANELGVEPGEFFIKE
jgi:transcriptional regulator with XRE-family HTH domain